MRLPTNTFPTAPANCMPFALVQSGETAAEADFGKSPASPVYFIQVLF